jgi:hypothetical protein
LHFLGVAGENSIVDEGVYCRPFTVSSGGGLFPECLVIVSLSGIFEFLRCPNDGKHIGWKLIDHWRVLLVDGCHEDGEALNPR